MNQEDYTYIDRMTMFYNNDSGQYDIELFNEIAVAKVITDLDTGRVKLQLSMADSGEDKYKSIVIERKYLQPKYILDTVLDFGLRIDSTNKDIVAALIQVLADSEQSAIRESSYSFLGYKEINGILRYFINTPTKISGNEKYNGLFNVTPTGSSQAWFSMYKKEVQGNAPLELAIAIALTAPLVYRIDSFASIGNLIFNLFGSSSTGKSTVLQLMLSLYGSPNIGSSGLISTFDTTDKAITEQLALFQGFLVGIDEATMDLQKEQATRDWFKMIYQMNGGLGRGRLDKTGKPKERKTFKTTIVCSSEKSILHYIKEKLEGLTTRLIEINRRWTNSKEHSDQIKNVCLKNYGHVIADYVNYIDSFDDEAIEDQYNGAQQILREKILPKSNASIRITAKLAIVLLAAKLMNKSPLPIKIDEITLIESLAQIESEVPSCGVDIDMAYEHIKEQIVINLNKFIWAIPGRQLSIRNEICDENGKTLIRKDQIYGKVIASCSESIIECWVFPHVLEGFLKKGGYGGDTKTIINGLVEKGIMLRSKEYGHNTLKRTILSQVRVYVIQFQQSLDIKTSPVRPLKIMPTVSGGETHEI